VAWINTGMVDPLKIVTNPSSNRARRSITSSYVLILKYELATYHLNVCSNVVVVVVWRYALVVEWCMPEKKKMQLPPKV